MPGSVEAKHAVLDTSACWQPPHWRGYRSRMTYLVPEWAVRIPVVFLKKVLARPLPQPTSAVTQS